MKKYSTQAYYNYAKRVLEGEAVLASTEEVDPDLKALYEAVDGLESKKPGSAEQFVKVIQTKYGVTSTNSLKKTLTDCLKIAVGGLSVSGFSIAIYKAIESGTALYRHIFSGNYVSSSYVTTEFALITFPCLLVSFIFYKILKYIVSSYNKTESVNTFVAKKLNKVRKQKEILESRLFVDRLNDLLIESEAGKVSVLNVTAEKSDRICRRMFNWIKEKVAAGWNWVKKHPYITIAFLIVIGCVFYYISVLRRQVASLEIKKDMLKYKISGLQNDVSDLKNTNSTLQSKYLKLNNNMSNHSSTNNELSSKLSMAYADLLNVHKIDATRMYKNIFGNNNGINFIKNKISSGNSLNSIVTDELNKNIPRMSTFFNVDSESCLIAYYKSLKELGRDSAYADASKKMLDILKHQLGDKTFDQIAAFATEIFN